MFADAVPGQTTPRGERVYCGFWAIPTDPRIVADTTMAERNERPDGPQAGEAATMDFAATVERLEQLVERLESGELSLEGSLSAFEEGVRLTRDAQRRLDEAELKVRTLTEGPDGGVELEPFAAPPAEDDGER